MAKLDRRELDADAGENGEGGGGRVEEEEEEGEEFLERDGP